VWMGVESGSQAVLNAMGKGLTLPSVRIARRLLKEAGIRACYFLQFGYPGESWAELQETISLVRETRPDDVGISFSYPLPGTVFYEQVQQQLGLKRNWKDSDDLCVMFTAAYTTDFYRAVRDALHAEVDAWRVHDLSHKTEATVRALWERVTYLEPVRRNPDAFAASQRSAPVGSSFFVPIGQLTPMREV